MPLNPLLNIVEVSKQYRHQLAVNSFSLQVYPNEILGLVGESGSGKSTLAKMVMMIEKPSSGSIYFNGINLLQLNSRERTKMRRQLQMIFQNPSTALNPRMTLQQILNEPLDIHHLYMGTARNKRIHSLLDMVGLTQGHLSRYPFQFSGGQHQRICIARALAVEPLLLVCDEPLASLDLSIQAQIINLLRLCQKELNLALLFISHDLAAVDMLADRVSVMYQGAVVEEGCCENVFQQPQHPYTKQLLRPQAH